MRHILKIQLVSVHLLVSTQKVFTLPENPYFYLHMKQVLIPALVLMTFSSCKFNPEALAKDYCNCRADMESGKKTVEDCQEMAESHYLKLQSNDEGLKMYTERVLDCISSSQIRTE